MGASDAAWAYEGSVQEPFPDDIDFMWLSNEDLGFIATLVTGTNDVFAFAIPYPASMDLFSESMIIHAIDFMHGAGAIGASLTQQILEVYIAMLDREFAATFRGSFADAEDENLKANLGGPFVFGNLSPILVTTAATEPSPSGQKITNVRWTPPVPLDAVTPAYVQFVNKSAVWTLVTSAAAAANYTVFEQTALRIWFTTRRLTATEMAERNQTIRFQRLDS